MSLFGPKTKEYSDLNRQSITEIQETAEKADGKSAYEIAVDHGFEGTEEEWLASLQGEPGPQGPKGDKGDSGYVGHYVREELEIVDDSYVSIPNGKIKSMVTGKYAALDVIEGEKYRVTGSYGQWAALYAFFNSSGQLISIYPEDETSPYTTETVEIIVPQNAITLKVSTLGENNILEVARWAENDFITLQDLEDVEGIDKDGNTFFVNHDDNILWGKKWAACGDSFTYGDFSSYIDSEGHSGKQSDAYDPVTGHYKTYPWWISGRNKMDVQWLAMGGNDFTNIEGATRPFSNPSTPTYNYTKIASNCDYVTLMFGLNESDLTAEQIGAKTDSDNTTLWGAYNVVLESILTANPSVKIGIIISDAGLVQTYHDALIDISKYWGIPYLDLRNGTQIPMMIGGRLDEVSATARTLRDNAFKCSVNSFHPNVVAHKYRSTVIENFLRSL